MTLDEKVGQCLTHSWRGGLVTPSVVETITRLHCGGLRIEPYSMESAHRLYYGRRGDTGGWVAPEGYFRVAETYFNPEIGSFNIPASEYAARLNRLKEIAMSRPSGVPLHICTDFEGDFSRDYPFDGVRIFPANMGIRAAGGPDLAFEVGLAIGRQLAAIGVNMIHSPVLDVNINPANPEINIRAFSDDPDILSDYATQLMRGLEKGGVIATAKHYPGRGDSDVDAHHGLPVLSADRARLDRVELAPYRALIAAGLRAVMVAHNAYPALDDAETPASLSRRIVTDLLRGELGFRGVITTDAIGMGAIVKKWGVPVASAMALKAGANLVLLKFDDEQRGQTFFEIKRWVEDGRLTEAELDAAVAPTLQMKADQGLFENGGIVDANVASDVLHNPADTALCERVAAGAVLVLRDRAKTLPLRPEQKVLVVEQIVPGEFCPNNHHYHAHSCNEAMLGQSMNLINADTAFRATERETETILALAGEADAVVMTNLYWRVIQENNTPLVQALARTGKPLVVVTNNPYPFGAPAEAGTVVCTFGAGPASLRAAAAVVYGRRAATASWPLENMVQPA
jgi:beta-N-acetylhexosaminidase